MQLTPTFEIGSGHLNASVHGGAPPDNISVFVAAPGQILPRWDYVCLFETQAAILSSAARLTNKFSSDYLFLETASDNLPFLMQ